MWTFQHENVCFNFDVISLGRVISFLRSINTFLRLNTGIAYELLSLKESAKTIF